ncbi:hypothetical protein WISP_51848 [Willisornis vidua]|uniref:Secreted protein n=1 Tax=Willisornis vidua TaxID=1566151 RepID=A0ABQ9DDK3_9PASS|nr:hypothetical protein WISP_51848 [Willisornis vidua]
MLSGVRRRSSFSLALVSLPSALAVLAMESSHLQTAERVKYCQRYGIQPDFTMLLLKQAIPRLLSSLLVQIRFAVPPVTPACLGAVIEMISLELQLEDESETSTCACIPNS